MISCYGTNTVSATGDLASDAMVHQNPAVAGFDSLTGSAPVWYSIDATGGMLCQDTLNLQLQVSGSVIPTCYKFSVTTDTQSYSAQTNSLGTASIVKTGSAQYTDNSTIDLEVQRVCSTSSNPDSATFTITGDIG